MPAQQRVRLSVELEPGHDPIQGSVAPEHGEPMAFRGWMELAATLQALIDEPPTARDDPPPPAA